MNKLTKLLSVFVIAGAIGTGVAGVAGCVTPTPDNTHTEHNYTYTDNGDGTHSATCDGCDETITNQSHVDSDNNGECDLCHGAITQGGGEDEDPTDKFVVDKDVDGLIIEGYGETDIQLSPTTPSHTIDKSAVKVYFAKGSTKGDEVPADNLDLKLTDKNNAPLESWEGLKTDGQYRIVAKLTNCVMEEGAPIPVSAVTANITITVHNAIVADSLVVKASEDAIFTQPKSAINSILPTWTFEATYENGEKTDVPTSEVTVTGLDTNVVTDEGVATLTWGEIAHGTQAYTITENNNIVIQSFAFSFSYLTAEQEAAVAAGDAVTLQDGRFEFKSATGGEIASHGKTVDGKYFAKRIKYNGASTAANTDRYIKVHVDGPATLTVYAYNNSGTAGTVSDSRQVGVYTSYEPTSPSGLVEAQNTTEKVDTKHVFALPEAGDYYICCVGGALTFTYVQIDQQVDAEGNEAIELGGDVVVSTISAAHSSGKTLHVPVGTEFDTIKSEFVVKATGVNNVTCDSGVTDVSADAVLTAPEDFNTIGEKLITVTYGGQTTTVKVIVDSEVEGIYGITSSLAGTVETQLSSSSAKLTLHKEDIVNSLVGENENASITGYTVSYNDTEMTDDGLEFAVSDTEYEITVTATVSDGEHTATITATIKFTVTVASTEPVQSFVVPETLPETTAIAAGATITESNLFKAVADGDMEYSIGKDESAGIPNSSKPVTSKLQDGTDVTFKTGLRTGATTTAGDPTTTVTITAKEKITLRIIAVFCNSSYNSNKTGNLSYAIGDAEATLVATGSNRQTPNVIEVTLEAGQSLVLGAQDGSDNGHLYLFAIEATQISE